MTKTAKPAKATPTPSNPEWAKPHEILLMSTAQNAIAMETWGKYAGEVDLAGLVEALQKRVEKVRAGDITSVEAMLYGQAMSLQTIFTNLARRSALNAGEHMEATDKYMRLALKAQAQCRATLETLAEIKNPRPVAFVKQANISHGHQQVNNGQASASGAGNPETLQNGLLEDQRHGSTYLDTGATSTATGGHSQMEAVGAVNRTEKPRG